MKVLVQRGVGVSSDVKPHISKRSTAQAVLRFLMKFSE